MNGLPASGRASPGALAVALSFALLASVFLGVRFGTVELTIFEVLEALTGSGDAIQRDIVLGLRFPRVAMAVLVGGGLAVAGAAFQALLRNPLAEPYILGISGGAAFGAVTALALGWAAGALWSVPLAAFAGAVAALAIVFGAATASRTVMEVRTLLLAGVVVAAFFGAMVALVLSMSEAQVVQAAVNWMMGSVAGADWAGVALVAIYTFPAVIGLLALSRPMNLLAIGEETAYHLGTGVEAAKRSVLLLATVITASGVAFAGVIGFVGLVVPHAIRMVAGSDNRALVPLAFLAGGSFLVLADLASRAVFSPREIPIGVVTATVGVPVFLVLLRRATRAAG